MSAPEPVRFGRYTVTRILGRGLLGRVYYGEDPLRSRPVAFRVIRAPVDGELKAATRLSHPGIIRIYDVGQAGPYSYVAMEYAPGGSLADQIEAGLELSRDEVADLAQQIAAAIDHADGQGVIHQDIRPENILLGRDGRYKLTDFRIPEVIEAVASGEEEHLCRLLYTSPEQVGGLPLTPSTDQFSLAAVVYRLLTGQPPFESDTVFATKQLIAETEPPSPSEVNPKVPAALSQVVMKALSKSPGDRYPSCRAFSAALAAVLDTADTADPVATDEASGFMQHRGLVWDDTVLNDDAALADTSGSSLGSIASGMPVRQWSIFKLVVATIILALVAGWLVWTLDLLGAPRVEATMTVDSDPPDQSLGIWLNDVPVGLLTPAEILLDGEEGENVRLALVRDDEVVASTNFTLAAEMTSEWIPDVEVPIRPVRYEVTSEPTGAVVRLDGLPIARPTSVEIDLFPGQEYEIMVGLDGYEPQRRTVDPADLAPEVSSLDFSLTRIVVPGRLVADAAFPLTVVARSDAGSEHRAQGRNPSLELQPGHYTLSVTAPEVFFTARTEVTLREGENVALPDLPSVVKILVFDVPGNATVRIDDFDPFPSGGPRTVTIGAHRFVFAWPTGERVVRDVQVERDGQEISARHP